MRFLHPIILIFALAAPAFAWDAQGHRTITYLAFDGLPSDTPDWLRDSDTRNRAAFQSNGPDRWRGWGAPTLGHEHKPDHFLDIEDLAGFGLTLRTIPTFRQEYYRALAISKYAHPEMAPSYDASEDSERTREWPGALPYAILEEFVKLQSAFNDVRIIESLNDPARAHQLKQARETAIYHIGVLSHYVGDAAQPLHTTRHYNGWVGENPHGYTTDRGFHAMIDGDLLDMHGLTYEKLKPLMRYAARLNPMAPWDAILDHIDRSHDQMEPLYKLEKSGELREEAGRRFTIERFESAASMLSAMIDQAWRSSAPNNQQIAAFVKYNRFTPESVPIADRAPQVAAPHDAAGTR
ncbi:MAG: hypothetical protein KDA32_11460 [Phycisphaerales bacterium]|nr:hypothetical protein [Phycisphaerales bacterium]